MTDVYRTSNEQGKHGQQQIVCLQCRHTCEWRAGSLVKAGQKLAVLSAMKMETAVQAPCDGLVRHVGVSKGDSLDAGKLLPAV